MTVNCRGLIIKGKWLDKIFAKKKVWEIRSSPTNIRGRIFLIKSGSGMVVGECNIVDCIKLDKQLFEQGRKYHAIEDAFEKLSYKHPYAWVIDIDSIKKYVCPLCYKHPSGAVIWVDLMKCCEYEKLLSHD